jgi:hypothetical protein
MPPKETVKGHAEDGVTGFLVSNEAEATAAVLPIGGLDRRAVRAAFERRFTARRMAETYLRLYQTMTGG